MGYAINICKVRRIVVATYTHDYTEPLKHEDIVDALINGHRLGEVLIFPQTQEFDTSPSGGAAGNRTPVHFGDSVSSTSVVRESVLLGPAHRHEHPVRQAQSQCKSRRALKHNAPASLLR